MCADFSTKEAQHPEDAWRYVRQDVERQKVRVANKERIHPQMIIQTIAHYWKELQTSLSQAEKGIQESNFILTRDSVVVAKGYLDVICKYADKAISDICVVTDEAEYEVFEDSEKASTDKEES